MIDDERIWSDEKYVVYRRLVPPARTDDVVLIFDLHVSRLEAIRMGQGMPK